MNENSTLKIFPDLERWNMPNREYYRVVESINLEKIPLRIFSTDFYFFNNEDEAKIFSKKYIPSFIFDTVNYKGFLVHTTVKVNKEEYRWTVSDNIRDMLPDMYWFSSLEMTKRLLSLGFDIKKVAKIRKFREETILTHIQKIYEKDSFLFEHLKPNEKIMIEVQNAYNSLKDNEENFLSNKSHIIKSSKLVELTGLDYSIINLAKLYIEK